ncbi:MAG: L,D-transpeptidase, partial [Pseudomonadota bacterium]|nr:L,D-transpeptidase [Pseudomonadota bacterium]
MKQVTFCARVLALVVALMAVCRLSAASAEPWVMVDTTKQTLTVRDGDRVLDTFTGIALGRNGAGIKQRRGDDVTPVGEFRVGWITGRSQFTLFIGLNYPNLEHASRALGD